VDEKGIQHLVAAVAHADEAQADAIVGSTYRLEPSAVATNAAAAVSPN
jgi:hypothetical protein